MDDRIDNAYIGTAIDDLVRLLGAKEAPTPALIELAQNRSTTECISRIAKHMGLPIKIKLSYISAQAAQTGGARFESSALVKAERHGSSGIIAQVVIPADIPMYGTKALDNFPITVRVSENSYKHPYVFVAIMAHEISHVLLHVLRSPQKENEIYTDLTPLVMGFGDLVARGRKLTQTRIEGNMQYTRTMSFGYLTDTQFDFARKRIAEIIGSHRTARNDVVTQSQNTRKQLAKLAREARKFKIYLKHVDDHPAAKVRPEDGQKLVQFHASDYLSDCEATIRQCSESLTAAENFCGNLYHYTKPNLERLDNQQIKVDRTMQQIDQAIASLKGDLQVLERYASPLFRLKMLITR